MSMDTAERDLYTKSFLQQYDGLCPNCEFRLNKPSSDRCPECGFRLIATLRRPSKLSAWLLFLMGLMVSFGICVDQLGLFLAAKLYQGQPLVWVFVLPEIILIVFLTAAIFVWWKLRNWVNNRIRKRARIIIGIFGIALPIIWFNVLFWSFVAWTR